MGNNRQKRIVEHERRTGLNLYEETAAELHRRLVGKDIKAAELVEEIFRRIRQVEPMVKAYLTLTEEAAHAQAEAVDQKISSGATIGPLAGIPLALKDILCTRGIVTTCASKILEGFKPPYDATVVERLQAAQFVMTGKTNMDEFAMGSSTENSAYQLTANPWDLTAVPGGSSGGSAAAVACGEAIWALGSDTGGSVRLPASFCGVVGMKPTYGRVSRYGLVAFASSLDQIGPLTRTVRDNAILLEAIAGHDRRDSTSLPDPLPGYPAELEKGVKGLRIGLPREMFAEGLASEVRQAVERGVKQLEDLGALVEEVSLPTSHYALPCYYIIATAEASANLARYDGVRFGYRTASSPDMETLYTHSRAEGFGAEVKRRIMLGTYSLSAGYYEAYYKKAQQVRTLIIRDFEAAFRRCDILATPTSPTTAFRLGEKTTDPLSMYLSDVMTVTVNLAGVPALSVPCGFDGRGLPIGLQLIGPPLSEATLYQAAYAFEQSNDYWRRRPPL